jgi:uncharacterized membrane protein SirB2
MFSYYLFLLYTHIGLATLSVALFTVRGTAVLSGLSWPMQKNWRMLSVWIDTLLMCAGVTLWISMNHNPFKEGWFGIKLGLLLTYIVLGSFALKRASTRTRKAIFFGFALLCAFTMITLATTRDTRAWFSYF